MQRFTNGNKLSKRADKRPLQQPLLCHIQARSVAEWDAHPPSRYTDDAIAQFTINKLEGCSRLRRRRSVPHLARPRGWAEGGLRPRRAAGRCHNTYEPIEGWLQRSAMAPGGPSARSLPGLNRFTRASRGKTGLNDSDLDRKLVTSDDFFAMIQAKFTPSCGASCLLNRQRRDWILCTSISVTRGRAANCLLIGIA